MEVKLMCNTFFCFLQQHGSVVGFRTALRVGLGSRHAAGHFPIWQQLGMRRQQPNIEKATCEFLNYVRTSEEFATRSKFG